METVAKKFYRYFMAIGREVENFEKWLDAGGVGATFVAVPLLIVGMFSVFVGTIFLGMAMGISW